MSTFVSFLSGPSDIFDIVTALAAPLKAMPAEGTKEEELHEWLGTVTSASNTVLEHLEARTLLYYHTPAVLHLHFLVQLAHEYVALLKHNQPDAAAAQVVRVRNGFNDVATWTFMAFDRGSLAATEE